MKKKKYILLLLILIILITCWGYISSKYIVSITQYSIDVKTINTPIRIVQLTDLHNSTFGKMNNQLVLKVKETKPDIIILTGDLINSDEEDYNIANNLIKELSIIAPVYISFGNHETDYELRYKTDLRKLYSESGGHVLEFNWEEVTVNGESIRLGGLYGYCLPESNYGEARKNECDFLKSFQNTEYTTILLCHMPLCWIKNQGLDEWAVDIVFAGHTHGGQVRIPFIGGLWAPDFGWLPGKLSGLYTSQDGENTLVLSRGLGTREKVPRLNNIPEIVVVDLK